MSNSSKILAIIILIIIRLLKNPKNGGRPPNDRSNTTSPSFILLGKEIIRLWAMCWLPRLLNTCKSGTSKTI